MAEIIKKFSRTTLKIFLALVLLMIITSSFTIVRAGERGVVLNFGAVSNNILNEGLHFVVPFYQVVEILDVKVEKQQVKTSAASKDLQVVSSTVALNYHLIPDQVNLLWKNIGESYEEKVINPAIFEAVKSSTAKFTAEELITKRAEVKELIKNYLAERLGKEYISVDDFSIVDFDFSTEFNKAIEAKQTAVQEALKAENDLKRIKIEAEQRITQAEAEAKAIQIQAQAITQQGGSDYVKLKAIEKWNGVLPQYTGGTIPFLNLNTKE